MYFKDAKTMRNGTTAPPGYVLPRRPRWQGGWNLRAVFGAALAFVAAAAGDVPTNVPAGAGGFHSS